MSDYDDMVSIAKIKIAGRQFSRSLATERTARLAAEARVKELENALLTCSQWAGNAAYNIRQHGLPTDMMACANTFDGIEKRARSTLHPGDGG